MKNFPRRIGLFDPPIKIDLGCKNLKRVGFIGMDRDDYGQEILWDVTDGIPVPDFTVTHIHMGDFLEHIADHDQPFLWHELYRISRNKTLITTKTPHANTIEGWLLMHLSRWDERRITAISRAFKGGFKVKRNERIGTHLIADLEVWKGVHPKG